MLRVEIKGKTRLARLKVLRNSPSWPQFKITSADQGRISIPVHYSFCPFTKRVKSLQEEFK